MTVHAHLSLKDGNHVHQPNTVVIPVDRKTFPVTVQWHIEADSTYVVAAPHKDLSHAWCLLDDGLRQIANGTGGGKKVASPKGTHSHVSRTVQGGGAHNPTEMKVELTGAKLKNGHTYTLVCKRYNVIASTDFVAISGTAAPKKPSRKKAAKKKTVKKTAAKKKTKKKTAKKTAKRKTAKKAPSRKKTTRKKRAKKKTGK